MTHQNIILKNGNANNCEKVRFKVISKRNVYIGNKQISESAGFCLFLVKVAIDFFICLGFYRFVEVHAMQWRNIFLCSILPKKCGRKEYFIHKIASEFIYSMNIFIMLCLVNKNLKEIVIFYVWKLAKTKSVLNRSFSCIVLIFTHYTWSKCLSCDNSLRNTYMNKSWNNKIQLVATPAIKFKTNVKQKFLKLA